MAKTKEKRRCLERSKLNNVVVCYYWERYIFAVVFSLLNALKFHQSL